MKSDLKYKDEILNEINDLSDEQIINLMKIIRIFKESIIQQRESDFGLKKELEEWDKLSDEAIINFEKIYRKERRSCNEKSNVDLCLCVFGGVVF